MAALNTTVISPFENSTTFSDLNTTDSTGAANSTQPTLGPIWGCIPAEVAFVVVASVGTLVVLLLASVLVLACQVCRLQRYQHAGRHTRSNVDLVSGSGYWGAGARAEGGGLVGPCDASVMLEEVKAQEELAGNREDEEDESEEGSEVVVTEDSRARAGITVAPVGELVALGEADTILPPPPPPPMPGSTSRDSCLEMGKDMEDMPLVV